MRSIYDNVPAPAARWPLDDNAATTVVKEVVGGLNGTAQQNTADLTTDGRVNTALGFNGSSDFINAAAAAGLVDPEGDYTVVGCLRTTDTGEQVIIALGNSTDDWPLISMSIGKTTAGAARFIARDDALTFGLAHYAGGYNDGAWHIFAGVKEGTTFKMYVDGVLKNTGTPATIGTTTLNTGAIGLLRRIADSLDFKGDIDEVSIFDKGLTAKQVKRLADFRGKESIYDSRPNRLYHTNINNGIFGGAKR